MIPLVDVHVHLLAGLDDGPKTLDEALVMCRLAHADGVCSMAATAHQNDRWPAVTPTCIRAATEALHAALTEARSSLTRLIAGLRRHRKQSRLLNETLRSIRQLKLTETVE